MGCRATLEELKAREATVRGAIDGLQDSSTSSANDLARGWATFEQRRDASITPRWNWSAIRTWWVAAGTTLTAVVLLLSVGSTRGWAQEFLSIFRVEHFTVFEMSPEVGASLQNNQMINQWSAACFRIR